MSFENGLEFGPRYTEHSGESASAVYGMSLLCKLPGLPASRAFARILADSEIEAGFRYIHLIGVNSPSGLKPIDDPHWSWVGSLTSFFFGFVSESSAMFFCKYASDDYGDTTLCDAEVISAESKVDTVNLAVHQLVGPVTAFTDNINELAADYNSTFFPTVSSSGSTMLTSLVWSADDQEVQRLSVVATASMNPMQTTSRTR